MANTASQPLLHALSKGVVAGVLQSLNMPNQQLLAAGTPRQSEASRRLVQAQRPQALVSATSNDPLPMPASISGVQLALTCSVQASAHTLQLPCLGLPCLAQHGITTSSSGPAGEAGVCHSDTSKLPVSLQQATTPGTALHSSLSTGTTQRQEGRVACLLGPDVNC